MKYFIQISFILCTALCASFGAVAQDINESAADSSATVGAKPSVQVAFRKVSESDILGSVSIVNMTDLIEKNYTTYSLDNMQGLVGGWTGGSLWGMDDYLVLVDGVPRDASNVMPTEIEQITFLKGASSVVLYGSRAAKGVIYITTKRGDIEPLKVNVRANTGYHVSKRYPKYLGSAEYMTLYNEALANDGAAPLYSDEQIYNYASGANPYRYPDVDLYSSEYLKKAYNRSDVTAELSGGNERSRFYTNIGYLRQGDVFNFGEAKNNFVDRFNVRGNIDLNITQKISAYVNANATFYNATTANSSNGGSYWTSAATLRPNRIAPLIPVSYIDPNALGALDLIGSSSNIIDDKYFLGGSTTDPTNIIADYYAGGSSKWTSRQFQFDAGLNFDLSSVMKGLTFHTQYAVDYSTSYTTSYNNTYATYEPMWYDYNGADVIGDFASVNGTDEKPGVQNISGSSNRQTIAFTSYFNYVTNVNGLHNISARVLATGFQQTRSQVYHRIGNANLGAEVNYNYKEKYYADLGAALVHSAKLAEGNRNGLSTSVTLGWKLNKESFLANSSVVDDLVLSVSGSTLKTDSDIAEFHLSDENYTQANGAWWGWYDGASERSTNSLRGGTDNLDFIQRKEFSANIRTSLFNQLITANASVFINDIEGLIVQPASVYPNYFATGYPASSFMPYVNFNNERRKGIDFNINVNKEIGEVGLSLGLSGLYYTTEATRVDEPLLEDYRRRAGKPIDAIWGLQSAGLFQDQADIDNSAPQKFGGTTRPGDIKYVDQNNDNRIDEKDEIYLGRGGWYGSPFTGGVNLTARYRGFTFFALGTADLGAYGIKSGAYFWVSGNGKYSEVVRDRWTEETRETATYPRLTTESGVNNFRTSDFWSVRTNRFNLARVQVSYALPGKVLQDWFFRDVSVYLSGANLLTISKERRILETNIGAAPQTRFYNIGVRATF